MLFDHTLSGCSSCVVIPSSLLCVTPLGDNWRSQALDACASKHSSHAFVQSDSPGRDGCDAGALSYYCVDVACTPVIWSSHGCIRNVTNETSWCAGVER